MTAITLEGLSKSYGSTIAVDGVDLAIKPRELFFLLGPSGCGKTTLLRLIAGFLEPDSGRIRFDGEDVTQRPPNRRHTGMVFQSYALWPHMSVFDNVAYGLSVRKVARSEKRQRTMTALRMVQMQDYADRRPMQLSGGEQQRIALARALVIEPRVLLLDEPLSNLDARLRIELREHIRRICAETGITTIYVTHDQKEALSLADRIAVLRAGKVVETGRPRDLYRRPHSRFVAGFLGETNFLNATVASADDGRVIVETPAGSLASTVFDETTPRGGNVTCSIRPESIRMLDTPAKENAIAGKHTQVIFLGESALHLIELDDGSIIKVLETNPKHTKRAGEVVHLAVRPDEVVILPD